MSALEEFANFITLNMANLAATYARLLAESEAGYETFPADSRIATARKLIKAVVAACESETSDPLCHLFDERTDDSARRWADPIAPPQPLLEIECLGQTLTPVVANLDAGKFLWQILSEVRSTVLPTVESVPPSPPSHPVDSGQSVKTRLHPVEIEKSYQNQKVLNALLQISLEESLQLTQFTVDKGPDDIVWLGPDAQFLYVNDAACRTLGYSREELLSMKVHDIHPDPRSAEVWPAHWAELKQRRSFTFETEHRRKNGQIFPVEITVNYIEFAGQEYNCAFFRDITERKRLEEQVQRSLERRTRQVETSTEIAQEIAAAPALDDLFDRVVNLVQERFGYYHARVYTLAEDNLVLQEGTGEVGRQMKKAGHELALVAEKSLIARAARSGEPVLVADVSQAPDWLPNPLLPETKSELAVPIKLRDELLGVLDVQSDTKRGLSEEDQLLLVGLCGQIAMALDNHRVETERKQTEKDLLRFKLGIERSGDAIFLTEIDGTIVYANSAFEEMYGYSQAEALGQTPRILKSGLISTEVYQHFWQMLLQKEIVAGEIINKTKDGRLITVEGNNNPILAEDGELIGFLAIHRDITEHKQAEELLAKRATELETVALVSTAATTIVEGDKLLQEVVNLTKSSFGLYHAHIYLLNETGDTLVLAAGAGNVGQQMVAEGWQIPLDQEQSLLVRAVRTRQGVIFNDVRKTSGWLPHPLLPDTRSEMAIPLLVGDQVLGVLGVQSEEANYFTDEDVRIQTTLAAQVAAALQNAELYEQTQAALRETQALQQLSQTLAGILQIDQVLDIFFQACTRIIGFEYVQFSLVDQAQQRLKTLAGVGLPESYLKQSNPSLDSDDIRVDIIKTGQTEVITGWDKRFDRAIFEAEGQADWVRVLTPVTLRQENIGLVEAGFNQNVQATIQDSQIKLLRAFIDQVALALDNAQRYEATQRAAHREQTIRQITERMRTATNLEQLVKTTAQELGERLSAGHAVLELGIETDNGNIEKGNKR